jgi:hypothetical protein
MAKLVTVQDVKDYGFKEESEDEFNSLIDSLIEECTELFEVETNREFELKSRTKKFNAGKRFFFLNAFPIDETINAVDVQVNGVSRTKDQDFFLNEESGIVEFEFEPTYTKPNEVSITWDGGWTTTTSGIIDAPKSLKLACKMQVSVWFSHRMDLRATSVSLPDGSISVSESADKLLPEVQKILKRYRLKPACQ